MLYADSYFAIGSTHRVCQDYALHGKDSRFYGIIADGCSSARDSDFGARILTKAAEQYVEADPHVYAYSVLARAAATQTALGLEGESLHATLGSVLAVSTTCFATCLIGDGVVAGKSEDGLQFYHIEYPSGAPYYLQYESSQNLKQAYLTEFGGTYTITKFQKRKGKTWEKGDVQTCRFNSHDFPIHRVEYSADRYDFVAIMSDGVGSVRRKVATPTSKTTETVPITEVVESLLNFKPVGMPNFTGSFVQRRFNRVFRDHPDWQHLDDIAIAVIAKGDSHADDKKKKTP